MKNLNLVEILKDYPKGTKLYSPIFGDVEFLGASQYEDIKCPIRVRLSDNALESFTFTKDGRIFAEHDGECMLFPSKEERDWSKFKYKKPKFDPKTLKPFDKIIFKGHGMWFCGLFSHIHNSYACVGETYYKCVIPYNDETKHLLGTKEEAPEFYRYWQD